MADPAALIANQVNQQNQSTDEEYSDYPEFPVPKDFTPPEGTQTGEPFQALGTFRIKSDGTMCLLEVDGSSVSSGEGGGQEETQEAAPAAAAPTAPNAPSAPVVAQ